MKLSKIHLSRLEYRNLRELIFLAHTQAEKDFRYKKCGFTDWLYIVAFMQDLFLKDDSEMMIDEYHPYIITLKIYKVEALIYLLNQCKPNPLHVLKGRLIMEVGKYKPNPVLGKNMISWYDNGIYKKIFGNHAFQDLDIDLCEYIKEWYFEELNQP